MAVSANCFKNHTNSLYSVFFFFPQEKKFCLMSSLKFTLSDVTLFLPDSLSWLKLQNQIQV